MLTIPITTTEENSLTVGDGDVDGKVKLLLVGTKYACTAHAFAVTAKANELLVMIVDPPDAAGTSQ